MDIPTDIVKSKRAQMNVDDNTKNRLYKWIDIEHNRIPKEDRDYLTPMSVDQALNKLLDKVGSK